MALIVGAVLILFAVYAVIPDISWGLQWGQNVLDVLKGIVPIVALLIGLIALLIGVADMKDKIEARREKSGGSKPE